MGRLTKPRAVRLAFALAVVLGGCAKPGPIERDHIYRLTPDPVIAPSLKPVAATLQVDTLAARGLLGGRQIVYRSQDEPVQVQRYFHYLWEQPPASALAQGLIEALREARLFELVIGRGAPASADYRLGGTLTRFEHRSADRPQRVAVAFDLLLTAAPDRSMRFSKSYRDEEPLAADTPTAMIAAFNRLTGRLIGAVVRDLQAERGRIFAPRAQ